MGFGCIFGNNSEKDPLYSLPVTNETFSKNARYTIRPDKVNVPEIEESKVEKWKIALTVAVLLTLIAILSAVLISQLNEEENNSSLQTFATSEVVQTTTKDVSHESTTPTTTEVQRTSTPRADQDSTLENNSSLQTFATSEVVQTTTKDVSHESTTPTTTEVQRTSTPRADQDSTLGMYTHY
ncbi:uncharacterized protein LOC144617676 [Crassostrea virginica]